MHNNAIKIILDEAGVSERYPEASYYLGQVFRHTTNSYKLVWFLAILSFLERQGGNVFRVSDILTEMVVIAWHPVCFYHLSLGCQDVLQHSIEETQKHLGLPASSAPNLVRQALLNSPEAQANLQFLKTYVPTRFLTPWFATELRGMKDSKKDQTIYELASTSNTDKPLPFYSFKTLDGERHVVIPDSWLNFIQDNTAIIRGYAEHCFTEYLQDRNPHVPGIVRKLRVPIDRKLTTARAFWRCVRSELHSRGQSALFRDIYTGLPLGEQFSVDHFLPWRFVVHDMLWNLVPVTNITNSRKNDILPDIELYLPRLVDIQLQALKVAQSRTRWLADYTECFREPACRLLAFSREEILTKYREVIMPQVQIAINQGFQYGWQWHD